jgi:hypothetical protein
VKKTLVTLLALVFVLGIAATAFAAPANPFVDVPAKHWAYGAVAKLVKAGVVDGYGDGTFRGDRAMTRYEMAQVVAKAMARSEKADAETKALIDKLAVEFAAELNNLGVRVAKLEANQPNVKFAGAFAARWTNEEYKAAPPAGKSNVSAQYRLRLDGTAKVDDKTSFAFRFVTREPDLKKLGNDTWQTFGDNGQSGTAGALDNTGSSASIDRVNFTTALGEVKMTLGRQALYMDQQAVLMDSGAYSFDGVKFVGKAGDIGYTVMYGRFLKGAVLNGWTAGSALQTRLSDIDIQSLAINGLIGKFNWTLGYFNLKNPVANESAYKWTLLDTKYTFDNKWTLQAEYINNGAEKILGDNGQTAWAAKLTFGDFVLNKAGAQNFAVQYYNVKANSTWNGFMGIVASTGSKSANYVDWTELAFIYQYAFSKSFNVLVEYAKVNPATNADVSTNENKHFRVVTTVLF